MDDLLSEFLTETAESLENLDVELVRLEREPNDPELLSNIFRLVHTIKGTCGFLGLPRLEAVAHAGENVLGKFRDRELEVTPEAVSLILRALDTIKSLLAALEQTEAEPEGDDSALIAELNAMARGKIAPAAVKPVPAAEAPAPAEPEPAPETEPVAAGAGTAPEPNMELEAEEEDDDESGMKLIERVGGVSAVDAAVELMYRKIMKDPELAPFFDGVDMTLLQGRQVEYMAAALGGPDEYTGGDIAAVHRRLVEQGLKGGHFDRMTGYLHDALVELEVPKDAIAEAIDIVASTRDSILGGAGGQPAADAAKEDGALEKAAAKAEMVELAGGKSVVSNSVRVSVDMLENLMTMVSELVLSRNQLLQILRKYEESEFAAPLQRLNLVTTDLQEGVMKTRMQPIGNAWSKLPRIVRDLSQELGKKIDLEMFGAETELDRQVLEMIKDPLTHMIRNSADHGVEDPATRAAAGKPETGRITLNAYHEGGHIIIEISDDGRGISVAKVRAKAIANGLATEAELDGMNDKQIQQFIFKPGFSTADAITNVSGRGVGMDVVRSNIEKIGGHIEMKSAEGKGSTFVVKIPLTLAIVSALIVECSGERFAMPQISVDELVRVSKESEHRIETINDTPVLRLRNRLLPLVALDELLKLREGDGDREATRSGETFIVVARVGANSVGIVVDRVFESEEIVVKPVTPVLREISIFSGNTILGDGSVIMILDPNGIAQATGEALAAEQVHSDTARTAGEGQRDERTTLLVFRAGGREPKAVPLALVARLEEIDRATIEESDGQPVVQYRGQLMPLIAVDPGFKLGTEGRQHVVVFQDGDRSMGVMVDEIVDIVEDRLNVELGSGRREGVLGTAVIAGKATDVLDATYYLKRAFGDWFGKGRYAASDGAPAGNRVLLVDDSPFFRNLLTPLLSVAGYDVTAVQDAEAALSLRESGRDFDVIISDIEMPGMNGFDLARAIKEDGAWKDKPILALSSYASKSDLDKGREVGFDDYVVKLDRDALLQSLSHSLTADRGAA